MNDILLDTNGDLSFQNGDLKTGYSDNQHQEHILIANKGEYREFPEMGVAIEQIINDDDYDHTQVTNSTINNSIDNAGHGIVDASRDIAPLHRSTATSATTNASTNTNAKEKDGLILLLKGT
jgi:hypothetical protein